MKLSLLQAKPYHIADCKEAIEHSQVGQKYFSNPEKLTPFFQEAIANGHLYVGLDDNHQVLGFIKYTPAGSFGRFPYIHLFAVKQRYRSQGVGSELITAFEREILSEQGKVFLLVADFNTQAKEFYQRLGYEVVGLIPDFYLDNIDEYIMMKRLPNNE